MAFLRRLSDEDQKLKAAKQALLRDTLAAQVQAKREEKARAREARLAREAREYAEERAARGLECGGENSITGHRGRGRVKGFSVGTSQMVTAAQPPPAPAAAAGCADNTLSPLRENKMKNNATRLALGSPQASVAAARKSFGRPKPFLATLNELHGGTSATEEQKKARARDVLRAQLAAQVRERERKKEAEERRARTEEAIEMQSLLDKGLDFWGQPLKEGAPPLELPERLRPYLPSSSSSSSSSATSSSANAPSPSAPTAAMMSPSPPPQQHYGDDHQQHHPRHYSDDSTERAASAPPAPVDQVQLEELTNLCRQLVEEQRNLRSIIDAQGEEIRRSHKAEGRERGGGGGGRSPPPRGRGRRRIGGGGDSTTAAAAARRARLIAEAASTSPNARSRRRRTASKAKKTQGRAAFGSAAPRMIQDRPAGADRLQRRRPTRRRHGRRGEDGSEEVGDEDAPARREMKPTKEDKAEARRRRIETRKKYAKQTRFVRRDGGVSARSGAENGAAGPATLSQRRQQRRQEQAQQAQQAQQRRQRGVDERPIRPAAGGPSLDRLDSQSQMLFGYDRKKDPLRVLASGMTPRQQQRQRTPAPRHQQPIDAAFGGPGTNNGLHSAGERSGDALDRQISSSDAALERELINKYAYLDDA